MLIVLCFHLWILKLRKLFCTNFIKARSTNAANYLRSTPFMTFAYNFWPLKSTNHHKNATRYTNGQSEHCLQPMMDARTKSYKYMAVEDSSLQSIIPKWLIQISNISRPWPPSSQKTTQHINVGYSVFFWNIHNLHTNKVVKKASY